MNKDVFNGFIQGVVAMYKLGQGLDNNLKMKWDIELTANNKCLVTCEYSTFVCDRLVCAGDYDNEPQFERIDERECISIEVERSNDLYEMAKAINNEILDYLTTVKPCL